MLDEGSLAVVDNEIDQTTGTVKLKGTFPNNDLKFWPGKFVNARLILTTEKDATVIPSSVVQRGPQGTYAYVIKPDKTVEMRPIKVGRTEYQPRIGGKRTKGRGAGSRGWPVQTATRQPRRVNEPARPADAAKAKCAVRARETATQTIGQPGEVVSISEPFIRRPVATSLLMAGVILLGLLGYELLPISALPTVDFPTIEVTTFYPGASADVMVSSITTPLERQFGQISGLASMNSTSSFGTSTITLQFVLDRPIDVAAQDVQAAINVAGGFLPQGLPNPPKYNKVNPADTPILTLSITSDSLPLDRVNDFADSLLAQKLSEVTGVGLVTIEGNQKPAVRVQVNPAAISSLGLSLEDMRTILGQANVNAPKGSFDGPRQSFTIGSNDQIFSADAYKPIIVAYKNGAPIRLGDIANIIDSVENDQLAAWVSTKNGEQPAVLLDIQRQPGANIIQTVENVKKLLPRLTGTLPPSVHVEVLADRTETIRASVHDVQFTLLLTIALVVLVMFLFLRKLWTTVITSIALPLSLIGTFGIMYLAGFSLDNLSLMALTISTGFVVDDAIVMIENIVRFIEAGDPPLEAALKGAKQIGFTVVSLSVSLVAVFIPLLFMTGIVGRLFREFAITLSVAVGVSAFISLTLTPMMCAKLLRSEGEEEQEHQGEFYRRTEEYWTRFRDWYERGLRWVLAHQRFVLNVAIVTLVATILLYILVPKGLLPQQDTGVIVGVTDAAENISFRRHDAKSARGFRHHPK